MRSWVVRVAMAVVTILFGALPSAPALATVTADSAYSYNVHLLSAATTHTTTERGPPTAYDRYTTNLAADRSSRGSSTRSEVATPPATSYATRTTPAHIAEATTTTGGRVVVADWAASSLHRAGVAAKSEGAWFQVTKAGAYRAGTRVPESFDLSVAGERFSVVPNATKHMAEYVTSRGASSMPMSSFAGAVETAVKQGLSPGRNFLQIGPWELGIDTTDNVIYHAVYRP